MSNFIKRIMYEAKYNRHIDDYTMALIGKESNYDLLELSPVVVTDEADCIDDDRLNDLIKYRKNDIGIKVDKDYYSLLQEAVRSPHIRKQYVLVDLGYSMAKITTESLYNAISDEIRGRSFHRTPDGDGLFVRINRQLLLDNDISFQERNEIDWKNEEWED
ncbi:MAG: hypothetical protein R2800_13680 [Flavipsychrobacter sp.]